MISRNSTSLIIASIVATGLTGSALVAHEDTNSEQPVSATTTSVSAGEAKQGAKTSVYKPNASQHMTQAQNIPALPSTVPSAQLPNGATSITESFGSWTVSCRVNEGQKLCTMAQVQSDKQTGQREFGIELLKPKADRTDGTILMPFGLKLDSGATLKLDDKELGQSLHFSTCIPQGCILPISFPAATTESIKKAKILIISSFSLSNGQAVTFSISLDGFPAALKRVVDLGS
jgi:invasion protein IalB